MSPIRSSGRRLPAHVAHRLRDSITIRETPAGDEVTVTTMPTELVARGSYTVSASVAADGIGVVTMPDVTAIVFVVDDDISVRESLELLIRSAGWQPETFASAPDLATRAARLWARAAQCLTALSIANLHSALEGPIQLTHMFPHRDRPQTNAVSMSP
jgi:hypothetical protein